MKSLSVHLDLRKTILAAVLLVGLAVVGLHARSYAAAGACTAPATDYGTVTSTVTIGSSGSGTYRVWTRMAAPDSTNNTILLQVDTSNCYTIGGNTVPVFTSTQDTNGNRFASQGTNWFAKDTTGSFIDITLGTGSHTFKIFGNAAGVVVDRIVLTQDLACNPTGTGDNCADPDTRAPNVQMTAPTNGATNVSTKPTLSADADDDKAIQKVDFYVDGSLVNSDTSLSYSFTLTTALSTGSHNAYAIATDTAGKTTQSTTVTFSVGDTTAPTISSVTATSITQTGATVTWTTNEAATSKVDYGTTTSYSSSTTVDSTKVTSHSVSLSGLTASTTYHYRVTSADAAGNSTPSGDFTFTTQAPSSDTTAPNITITAPTANATVKGKMDLKVTATDNIAVVGVQYKLDGANIGNEVTASPFTLQAWKPAVYSGTHTITALARDAAGNTKTATVNITINVQAADVDVSGLVDYLDLSAVAGLYGKTGAAITTPRADVVNTDGLNIVNYLDLSAVAGKYGT